MTIYHGWTMDTAQARQNRMDREDDSMMGLIRLITQLNIAKVYIRLMRAEGYIFPDWTDDPKYWAVSERA